MRRQPQRIKIIMCNFRGIWLVRAVHPKDFERHAPFNDSDLKVL